MAVLLPATADKTPRAVPARAIATVRAVETASAAPPAARPEPEPDPESLPPSLAHRGVPSVVRGRLVDDTGAPVPSARIRGMQSRPFMGPRRYAVQGHARDGAFVFRFDPRPFSLSPPDPTEPPPRSGEEPISFWVVAPGCVWESFELDAWASAALRQGSTIDGLTVVLQRGAIVEGAVYLPDRGFAEGAEVGVVDDPRERTPDPHTRGRTDGSGNFRLTAVDPRRPLWLHARHRKKRLFARRVELGRLTPGATHTYEIALEPVRRVDVTFGVVNPVPGLRVQIDYGAEQTVVDGFHAVRLDSGPHRAIFTADGRAATRVRFWLKPHAPTHHLRVHLD